MAFARTLSDVMTRCQRRAGRDDGSMLPAEVKSLVTEFYGELHTAIVETGCRVFETEASITATGAAYYALPSDHRETIGVDLLLDAAGQRMPLDEIMVQERAYVLGRTGQASVYELTGSTIVLYPTPSSGTYKHLYVPQPTDYASSADSTSVDFGCEAGLAFVVWAFAVVAKEKDEADLVTAMRERDRSLERAVSWACNHRSTVNPRRRVYRDTLAWGTDPDSVISRWPT